MSDQIKILIVDDDDGIRYFLAKTLTSEQHDIVTASTGEQALELLRDTSFDLALLDLHLGGRINGMRVLQAVNWRWPNTAKIILTGHGTLDSAIEAIREGVDAFLLKPVKVEEIRQVVTEVLTKRESSEMIDTDSKQQPSVTNSLKHGSFSVDAKNRRVIFADKLLDLTNYEYDLLVYLIENDDRPFSPIELVQVVRGYKCDHMQEARDIVKWYIYSLRRKVEPKPSYPRHILNVRGVGYIFKA